MAPLDKKSAKPSTRRARGILTLSDLNRPTTDPDSDSDGPQEYYTGGENSGMLGHDPNKANDMDAISDQANQLRGSESLSAQRNWNLQIGVLQYMPNIWSRSNVNLQIGGLQFMSSTGSFAGTGRLLSGETVQAAPQQPESIVHNIVFWSDGFTVNDGPLRSLNDPENASFLESIRKSECPKELESADRRASGRVNLIRRNEKCPEPEKRHVPFQGVGRTLGSSSTPAATEPTVASIPLNTAPTPSMGVFVDQTLPLTSVQLRLADGTQMVARFNYHHTINDIRSFIDASRPGSARNYQLQMMGFPPKVLSDQAQTIDQAGLANSVVIQKF